MLVDIQGGAKGPDGLFLKVIFDYLRNQVLLSFVAESDDAALKTYGIDEFIKDLRHNLILIGLDRQKVADPEDTLEEAIFFENRSRNPI